MGSWKILTKFTKGGISALLTTLEHSFSTRAILLSLRAKKDAGFNSIYLLRALTSVWL